ncbi:MAG: hypothetical protein E6J78_17575 [Deltaproteobacteria bacterium]|nr:MAG: hypothetical protein E6J78_17575 [Deltaproteobacteria bacterium]
MKIVDVRGEIRNATSFNHGQQSFMFIDNLSVIHPNGIARAAGAAVVQRAAKTTPLRIRLRWYCESMRWREETVELHSGDEIELP